jgi:hypothetical protein
VSCLLDKCAVEENNICCRSLLGFNTQFEVITSVHWHARVNMMSLPIFVPSMKVSGLDVMHFDQTKP